MQEQRWSFTRDGGGDTRPYWVESEDTGRTIAKVGNRDHARLIAAAPALLAALEGLSDTVLVYQADGYNQDTYRQMGKANEAARQAIAQARGEEAGS